MNIHLARIEWNDGADDWVEVHSNREAALASLAAAVEDQLNRQADLPVASIGPDLDVIRAVAESGGWFVSLETVTVQGPTLLAPIYVPPVPCTDDDYGEFARLKCPHCDGVEVVEVDIALRWNYYDGDIDVPNRLTFGTDGDYTFETDHMLCTDCDAKLANIDDSIAVNYS